MTHRCCVRDCEEAVREARALGLPLHKFPKDVMLRAKWLTSGGFDLDFRPTNSQTVCYKHFKLSDYELGRSHKLFLKKGSVPSVFSDYENHPDPIGPESAVVTSRLHARELKLSQSLVQSASPGSVTQSPLAGYLDTSCSSLEASLDSSASASTPAKAVVAKPALYESKHLLDRELLLSPNSLQQSLFTGNPQTEALPCKQLATAACVMDKSKQPIDTVNKPIVRPDLDFNPGAKLEAKDFNEKWYSAKVVEVDWIEREVLIHFDKWSSRYDEWIQMDSSRLRMHSNPKEQKVKVFTAGEKVLATWIDGKKYPARVHAVLENDKYDVLFDDGYAKILKPSKITKISETAADKAKADNPYYGSKQERRDKKRKHTVTELFQTHSKKKTKADLEKVADYFKSINKLPQGGIISNEFPHSPILAETSPMTPISAGSTSGPFVDDNTTFIGNLKIEVEDSTYKCPKPGCNKNFRKENLLQMHLKHYHPEYSQFLGSTPNVADLAYARTIGEPVEDFVPKKPRTSIQSNYSTPQSTEAEPLQAEAESKLTPKIITDNNTSIHDDTLSEQSNSCTMSPGTLFDMRFKEEKTHTGIKTLLPIRQPYIVTSDEAESEQPTNIVSNVQKLHPQEKRTRKRRHQYQHHNYDSGAKIKKPKLSLEPDDNFQFDDSFIDGEDLSETSYKYNNSNNSRLEVENNDSIQSKASDVILINGELVKVEKLKREEIINCTCGITEEDGLMIQCDLCLCWQHGHCNAIEREVDVPEKYICYTCQHSHRQRSSKKYFLDQDWIREGKLPNICTYPKTISVLNKRTAMLKRSYELISGLLQIKELLHSLRVKVNVAQNKDHPKLYLWAKNWSKVKIPVFPTTPVPIMEVIKSENCNDLEESNTKEQDFSFNVKSDPEDKQITSDTELMKILEEDQADETKPPASLEPKDDSNILTDSLTQNNSEEQNQLASIKNEIKDEDLLEKQNPVTHNGFNENVDKSPMISAQSSTMVQPVIPEPEAPIDPVECKLRLLEHLDHFHNYIDATLNFIEVQLSALEDKGVEEKRNINQDTHTKQTIQMLLHDLESMRKLAALC